MKKIVLFVSALLLSALAAHSTYADDPTNFGIPLSSSNVPQSYDCLNCYSSTSGYHTGIDYTGSSQIYPSAPGKIVKMQPNGENCKPDCHTKYCGCLDKGLGNSIIIEHSLENGDTVYSLYGHLDSISSDLSVNDYVTKNDNLGVMGGTGYGLPNKYAVHLHFELKSSNVLSDPVTGTHFGYTPETANNYGYYNPGNYFGTRYVCTSNSGGTVSAQETWLFNSDSLEGWAICGLETPLSFDEPMENWLNFNPDVDPKLYSPYINRDPKDLTYIEFRGINLGTNNEGRVYLRTESQEYSEGQKQDFIFPADGKWHTIKVRLDSIPAWKDALLYDEKITGVRIDPVENGTGDNDLVSIDYIFFRSDYSDPIAKALNWLREVQNKTNGSWQNHVGYTAMASLAFLNAGYTEDDDVVYKGIQYLLSYANLYGDGGIYKWYGNYETSLSILALKATSNSDYNDEIANAANYLKSIQSNDLDDPAHSWHGGWGYSGADKNNWSDLSNSQFSAMALDAAGVPKDDAVWARFLRFLSRVQNLDEINDMPWANGRTDGGFTYSPHYNIWNNYNSYGGMTAAGIWGLRLSGIGVNSDRVEAAIGWLASNEDLNFNSNPMLGNYNRYYYYMAFAKAMAMCFLSQDDAGTWYEGWYDALKSKIASEQAPEGYWNQSQGMWVDTFWALLALQTLQEIPSNLWMTIILASPADLLVYDSQDRVCSKDECNLPGAEFLIDNGEQIVNLTQLEPGHYRFVFIGTGDGTVHLTVNGHRDEELISTETKEFEIRNNEVLQSDVLVSSLVGVLTITVEDPEPPPFIPVDIDIKPGSCPNPLDVKSKGVLPLAVLGIDNFDVTTIDPATIRLSREGIAGDVAPLRWSYEDVATPFAGELCDCHNLNGDGFMDLTLKLNTQELVGTLNLEEVAGETIPLTLTGNLKEEYGNTSIEGKDCIWVK